MRICKVPYDGSSGDFRRLRQVLLADGLPAACPSCGGSVIFDDVFTVCPDCEEELVLDFVAQSDPVDDLELELRMHYCGAFVWVSRLWAIDDLGAPYFRIAFLDPFSPGRGALSVCPVCDAGVGSWLGEDGVVDAEHLASPNRADRRKFEEKMAEWDALNRPASEIDLHGPPPRVYEREAVGAGVYVGEAAGGGAPDAAVTSVTMIFNFYGEEVCDG